MKKTKYALTAGLFIFSLLPLGAQEQPVSLGLAATPDSKGGTTRGILDWKWSPEFSSDLNAATQNISLSKPMVTDNTFRSRVQQTETLSTVGGALVKWVPAAAGGALGLGLGLGIQYTRDAMEQRGYLAHVMEPDKFYAVDRVFETSYYGPQVWVKAAAGDPKVIFLQADIRLLPFYWADLSETSELLPMVPSTGTGRWKITGWGMAEGSANISVLDFLDLETRILWRNFPNNKTLSIVSPSSGPNYWAEEESPYQDLRLHLLGGLKLNLWNLYSTRILAGFKYTRITYEGGSGTTVDEYWDPAVGVALGL